MCLTHLESFISVVIFLSVITSYHLNLCVTASSEDLKSTNEIESIFHSSAIPKHGQKSVTEETSRSGNFAEGGSVGTKGMMVNANVTPEGDSSMKKDKNSFSYKATPGKSISIDNDNNSNHLPKVEDKEKKYNTSITQEIQTQHLPKKLNENGSNLFLGVPEVVHINGTSSIKPRKGVYYNKIVPRKGVDTENEESNDYLNDHSCFQINKNECYSALKLHNVQCSCCKESNLLGKMIKEQPLVNCSNCKPVNSEQDNNFNCQNICCNNEKLDKESYMVANEDLHDTNLLNTEIVKQNKSEYKNTKEMKANSPGKIKLENIKIIMNSTRIYKSKPLFTKVPHDVETVNEYLTGTNGIVYVPVIISVFLLPILCVLIFFLWRRVKEFWDKRYYKKVDFLIDGIYND